MLVLSQTDNLLWCMLGYSQRWTHTNKEQHPQGDALVQIPLLHGYCDHQSPHKQQVCVLQVLHTHLGHTKEDVCEQKCIPAKKKFYMLLQLFYLHLWIS